MSFSSKIFFTPNKKQVSIVDNNEKLEQSARNKREKFQRQDTPLHPQTPAGSAKRLSIPRSLSINVTQNTNHPSTQIRTISYDERQKSPDLCPLGLTTRHKKTQNLSSSAKKGTNVPKLKTAPR